MKDLKTNFFVLIVVTILFSCKSSISEVNHIIDKEFEIYKVANSKATLVLFPCFPCNIEKPDTRTHVLNAPQYYRLTQKVNRILL